MKQLTCILTENRCYKTGKTIKPKGIMVHSTGANNPTLKRYVQPVNTTPNREHLLSILGINKNANHWNRPTVDACVHAFIGKLADGSIATIQTLPWNWRGWHAGTGTSGKSANDTHISFEICEDDLTDHDYFNKVYQEAVDLTTMLCLLYDLDPMADGVIVCHIEGYNRGIASGHGDVMHWFPKHGKTMNDFRKDVNNAMRGEEKSMENSVYKTLDDVPDWAHPTIWKLVNVGAIGGVGNGALDLSFDFCRVMTVLDRLGKL